MGYVVGMVVFCYQRKEEVGKVGRLIRIVRGCLFDRVGDKWTGVPVLRLLGFCFAQTPVRRLCGDSTLVIVNLNFFLAIDMISDPWGVRMADKGF